MFLETIDGGGIRVLAPAKINLYLDILGLRPDGYHEIDTLMQVVSLFDELRFRPRGDGEIRLEMAGTAGGGSLLDPEKNLVVRAARLLDSRVGRRRERPRGVDIWLKKRIPVGGGLGGGSSDAAATLLGLSRLWDLRLPREDLVAISTELGSDVPFFLFGGTARCQGKGEKITPLESPPGKKRSCYVLVCPGFNVPTPFVYERLDRLENLRPGLTSKSRLDTMSLESIWEALHTGELFFNKLQLVACQAFPKLGECLEEVSKEPFIATLMSGSGSTIYGVCHTWQEAGELAARLQGRVPGSVFVVEGDPQSGRTP